MDQDQSLLWHGPLWYAGFRPAEIGGAIPGVRDDQDLVAHARAGTRPPPDLPLAIVATPALLGPPEDSRRFFQWLDELISGLTCEVPLVLLVGAEDQVPDRPRAHAVINLGVSPHHLFEKVCRLQRSLIRSEEARLRRIVFGRQISTSSAQHHTGPSGLLVIGVGQRFLELQNTAEEKIDVIGAFDQRIAEDYLRQRAFDAVILDGDLADVLENLRQLRFDARFATLPVLVFSGNPSEAHALFEAGATDVLPKTVTSENLRARMRVLVRGGKRRRLADRILSESRKWLMHTLKHGGLSEHVYTTYLERARATLKVRGLSPCEIWLAPPAASPLPAQPDAAIEVHATVLSIAEATSREEDLVCVVENKGPVAVLKSDRGRDRLTARIKAILSHTVF